jgi:hypothetical protein
VAYLEGRGWVGVGFLQAWLDEPDESIARFAKAFYALTFLFMAAFVALTAQAVWRAQRGDGDALDFVGPVVSAFVTLTLYSLALDGRRSYKAMKERRSQQ